MTACRQARYKRPEDEQQQAMAEFRVMKMLTWSGHLSTFGLLLISLAGCDKERATSGNSTSNDPTPTQAASPPGTRAMPGYFPGTEPGAPQNAAGGTSGPFFCNRTGVTFMCVPTMETCKWLEVRDSASCVQLSKAYCAGGTCSGTMRDCKGYETAEDPCHEATTPVGNLYSTGSSPGTTAGSRRPSQNAAREAVQQAPASQQGLVQCASRCVDLYKKGDMFGSAACSDDCKGKMGLCQHCCALKEATATEAHCEAVCGDNMTAYVCR
jgi:hypothetical protein